MVTLRTIARISVHTHPPLLSALVLDNVICVRVPITSQKIVLQRSIPSAITEETAAEEIESLILAQDLAHMRRNDKKS